MIYARFVASLILRCLASPGERGGEGEKKDESRECRRRILVYGSDKCGIRRNSNFIEPRVCIIARDRRNDRIDPRIMQFISRRMYIYICIYISTDATFSTPEIAAIYALFSREENTFALLYSSRHWLTHARSLNQPKLPLVFGTNFIRNDYRFYGNDYGPWSIFIEFREFRSHTDDRVRATVIMMIIIVIDDDDDDNYARVARVKKTNTISENRLSVLCSQNIVAAVLRCFLRVILRNFFLSALVYVFLFYAIITSCTKVRNT